MNSFQLRLRRIKSAPFITIGLIAVNVIVFVLSEIGGSSEDGRHMYEFGAMLTSAVAEDGEYWRLLTSMFLHFGFEHLASNMLVLFALGTTLEHGIGQDYGKRGTGLWAINGLTTYYQNEHNFKSEEVKLDSILQGHASRKVEQMYELLAAV